MSEESEIRDEIGFLNSDMENTPATVYTSLASGGHLATYYAGKFIAKAIVLGARIIAEAIREKGE